MSFSDYQISTYSIFELIWPWKCSPDSCKKLSQSNVLKWACLTHTEREDDDRRAGNLKSPRSHFSRVQSDSLAALNDAWSQLTVGTLSWEQQALSWVYHKLLFTTVFQHHMCWAGCRLQAQKLLWTKKIQRISWCCFFAGHVPFTGHTWPAPC